jgi:CspA family cold shock protein
MALLREDITDHHGPPSFDDLEGRIADFQARIHQDPIAVADRRAVKDPSIRRRSPPCQPPISFAACKTLIRRTRLPEITLRPQGPAIPTGLVTWFNAQKGEGFLQPAHGDQDVFVPLSAGERCGRSRSNEGAQRSDAIANDPRTGTISAVTLPRIEPVQLGER